MITLDAIRSAILAADPYTQMDQLVRAEMNTGRKVRDIFDDINPLVDEALDTTGLTEDGEEALWGTLDALTGNCRSDQCYYDPPGVAQSTGTHANLPANPVPPEAPPWSLPK
jgi:hypothetical protein